VPPRGRRGAWHRYPEGVFDAHRQGVDALAEIDLPQHRSAGAADRPTGQDWVLPPATAQAAWAGVGPTVLAPLLEVGRSPSPARAYRLRRRSTSPNRRAYQKIGGSPNPKARAEVEVHLLLGPYCFRKVTVRVSAGRKSRAPMPPSSRMRMHPERPCMIDCADTAKPWLAIRSASR